jgi:hypothetical protein
MQIIVPPSYFGDYLPATVQTVRLTGIPTVVAEGPLRSIENDISLVNDDGDTVTTISTDTTLAHNSDVELVTQKALKAYIDTQAPLSGLTFSAPLARLIDNVSLKNTATNAITEVSTDTTLGDDSDIKIATQHAVKTYVAPAMDLVAPLTYILKDGPNATMDIMVNGATAMQFNPLTVFTNKPFELWGPNSVVTIKDNATEQFELIRRDGLGPVSLLTMDLTANTFTKAVQAPSMTLYYSSTMYTTFVENDFSDMSITPSSGGTMYYNGPLNVNSATAGAITTIGGASIYQELILDGGLEFTRAHDHPSNISIDVSDQVNIDTYSALPLKVNEPLAITAGSDQVTINNSVDTLTLNYENSELHSNRNVAVDGATPTITFTESVGSTRWLLEDLTTEFNIRHIGLNNVIVEQLSEAGIGTAVPITVYVTNGPQLILNNNTTAAGLNYNGTTLISDKPVEARDSSTLRYGTSLTKIQTTTIDINSNLVISNPRWDMKCAFAVLRGGSATAATWAAITGLDFYGWEFAKGDKLYGTMPVGGDFSGASITGVSNINFTSANATAGSVHWEVEVNYAAPAAAHSATYQALGLTASKGNAAYLNIRSTSAQFTLASPAKGGMLLFRIRRINDGTDTYPDHVWLTGMCFQVLCDKLIGNHNSV